MGIFTFSSSDQIYACIGGLFYKLKERAEIREQIKSTNLIVRFNYFDPEATITLDGRDDSEGIIYGSCDLLPDVEFTMSASLAHEFWLDRVNLLSAIAKREIIFNGSLSKVMKFVPIIKLAFEVYPEHLKELGHIGYDGYNYDSA